MSFILDALKKSESDRQRQSGPALYEVRVAPPRSSLPLWAVAIAALLAINIAIVVWMMLRSPTKDASATAVPVPAAAAPAAQPPPVQYVQPQPVGSAPPPVPLAAPPAATPQSPARAVAGNAPLQQPVQQSPAPLVQAPATPAPVSPAPVEEAQNPQDYAPAQEGSAPNTHVRRASAAGVPLYQDAAATPGTQIPQLHLDFHMYAPEPAGRFVMINMHKLREGDSLPDGVHVNSITPEGAVLSYNGQTFMLPRE
jgi:general secretion pathway protein B